MLACERKKMTVRSFMPSCGRILNIGCGTFQYFLQKSGTIINCDIDKKDPENFVQCSAEKIPFRDDSFDSIIAFDVIGHLKDEKVFL